MNNVKVPKMPSGGAASALIKLGVIAGLGMYGVANSLYNVEGGHRAIVFNRVTGVKEKVFSFPIFFDRELTFECFPGCFNVYKVHFSVSCLLLYFWSLKDNPT